MGWSQPGSSHGGGSSDTERGLSPLHLDNSTGLATEPTPAAVAANPKLAVHAAQLATEKLKYGALMDQFESDRFAKENQLAIAGGKFEKQFVEWQGVRLLEKVPAQQLQETQQSKGSMILHNQLTGQFKLPKINHDGCPGCGATLQDSRENDFGYCAPGEVENFIISWQAAMRARGEYAERMHELTSHWEKHGKRVGEEWLDFMTQDEFDAIYRWKGRPFVCRRCAIMRNHSVTTADTVLTAPDFKEKLASLRERKCVIVLVIDVTDFPGTMVPDLPGLISMNNPVIICANKIDCVIPRNLGYNGSNRDFVSLGIGRGYINKWVREQATQFRLPDHAIKKVIPVSAYRGWNINELIETIEQASNLSLARPTKPVPTYFVSVSNVGKSSVINAIARALHVPQPPHPTSVKQYYTVTDPKTGKERINFKWVTDKKLNHAEMVDSKSRKSRELTKLLTTSPLPGTTINAVAIKIAAFTQPVDTTKRTPHGSGAAASDSSVDADVRRREQEKQHTYLFDTPGVHPIWQPTSPLTIREQMKTLIVRYSRPDFLMLTPGSTLFFGGACAIDVVRGPEQVLFATYHSRYLKTDICDTDKADAFWAGQLGKKLVPPGSLETLAPGAGLSVKRSYLFECFEHHKKRPKADIYFCGMGWVSFFTAEPADLVLRVRTLPGVVHGVRQPLRNTELRKYRPWPRLIGTRRALKSDTAVSKVIRLVAGPVNPSQPALKKVEKAVLPAPATPIAAPFDFVVDQLKARGQFSS